jgi:hypothetical protein
MPRAGLSLRTRNVEASSVFSFCIMSHEGSPVPGTRVQALAGADFRAIIKESLLEVLRENPQVLQPTAGDQPQPQVNEGGKLLLCYTPRIPNGSRGGKPSPWSLLLRYLVGSAGQITSGRICLSDQVNLSNNYIMFTFKDPSATKPNYF